MTGSVVDDDAASDKPAKRGLVARLFRRQRASKGGGEDGSAIVTGASQPGDGGQDSDVDAEELETHARRPLVRPHAPLQACVPLDAGLAWACVGRSQWRDLSTVPPRAAFSPRSLVARCACRLVAGKGR